MQEGETGEITHELLRSDDGDNAPEDVVYSIRTPTNGKVVLASLPGSMVLRFTQAQINNGLVRFVHEGSYWKGRKPDGWEGVNDGAGLFAETLS